MMYDAAMDPAIKLFGRTIALPDGQTAVAASENSDLAPMNEPGEVEKDTCGEATKAEVNDQTLESTEDLDHNEADVSSDLNNGHNVNNQTRSLDDKMNTDSNPEQPEQHGESDASNQEKVLKKPDKILPCPRCNSMDTKFCYYNNYNVNQPRHFCKNCQRYWTAGGTMRNVPVGAGRRKSKHSSSHHRHLLMSSDGMPSPRVDNPDSGHGQLIPCGNSVPSTPFAGNRTVLKFGQEAPLCESMANTLSIADQKRKAEMSPVTCGENVKEPSCASSVTASNCMENVTSEKVVRLDQTVTPGPCNGLTPVNPLQCYPGSAWAYPWGPGWNNIAAIASAHCTSEVVYGQENGGPKLIPWSPPAMMTAPAFCAPPMAYPFVPASFWGCMATWPNGSWNAPWSGNSGILSPSSSASSSGFSGNHSPTLGKHSRDAGSQVAEQTEKSLWIPKTLRIDDPDEAAKSSIWATLGIKPDRNVPIAKGGIFKSFQSRTEDGDVKRDSVQVLHANPAALSRSNTFQEST